MKNTKYSILFIAFIIAFILIGSCTPDDSEKHNTKKKVPVEKNLNISLLLDLSDRIDTTKYPNETMQYYKRDIGYIKAVADVFATHVATKKAFYIQDNIQVFIDPEPKSTEVNGILQSLKYEFTRKTPNIVEEVKHLSKNYENKTTKLYAQTLKDNDYVGSDIWNFFKKKVKDFCVAEGKDNYVIIITDGYMYHQQSKYDESRRSSYLTNSSIKAKGLNTSKFREEMTEKDFGFIATRNDLKDLKVLVLGINPSNKFGNPYEGDVIQGYWEKWLDEMGVKFYKVKEAELPTNAKKLIEEFLMEY